MKIAVIGSRTFADYDLLEKTLSNINNISAIVSGGAKGADSLAEKFAKLHSIPTIIFKPDWSLGRHAGFLRNTTIIENCDLLIAFWDNKSKGTLDSINKAKKLKKGVTIVSF